MNLDELAQRVSERFRRVHAEVFRGDPVANPSLEVEVRGSGMGGDTAVLVLVTPWTLNGLAFPEDGRFPEQLVVNQRRYPVFSHELDGVGPYRSVNLVPDVSRLAGQDEARRLADELAEHFRAAVARAREVADVSNPSRRRLFRLSDG
jgi:hypothetical protein